ncbi:hemolysin family protein [Desulfovibrio mangrovi]|uniref:hemolysin family protein n=1 Tax=Desulfovibrio mangrovi TaxID=2976983 RepID=UPI002246BFE1|nr:hemolysin family protein [Desulfovibrio mangrovi]UZP68201.1 hemolysin family protein [Desulfovibrio mangrovi]
MDGGSDSRLWSLISNIFNNKSGDSVEKAILEAREEGELEAVEGSMLLNVLSLDETQVDEIMVPRTDIHCIEINASVREVVKLIIESGHSRIPIYEGNRDNIVGVAYAKDVLRFLYDPALHNTPLRTMMRKPFFVPETKMVSDLLQEFRARKLHFAIAVDEYGGTSGVVTIEDILEIIVGDIDDEYDLPKEEDIRKLDDNSYMLSGRALLEELEPILNIRLESEQVETIGGYLSELAGHVPQAGETFMLEGYRFSIKDANAKLIQSILVERQD